MVWGALAVLRWFEVWSCFWELFLGSGLCGTGWSRGWDSGVGVIFGVGVPTSQEATPRVLNF